MLVSAATQSCRTNAYRNDSRQLTRSRGGRRLRTLKVKSAAPAWPPYGGARFPVEAQMAGRRFAQFHLDVSSGDVLREPYEVLEGRDWFGFAGLSRARVPAVSREEQFAEKLHAYTLPREGRPNSRVKDLVDLALLIEQVKLDMAHLPKAIHDTFQRRKTHEVPTVLAEPPVSWSAPFAEMARECGIEPDINNHFSRVRQFYGKLRL